uniref:Glutathione S-transferase epsilon n=1 Tax=Mythimna separata TaxID=271217 RepID=A0A482LTG8_MYTSE|nr:glutathione S-transferase epsilon [Mythimna separata]
MVIRIHKIDASPPVRGVLMTVELLKLKFEPVEVDFMGGEHLTPEYREKNPLHSVPYLEDGDFLLADSHAIITYLVSKYGGDKRAELYPAGLQARAIVDQKLFFDTANLFPCIRGIVKTVTGGERTSPTPQQIQDVHDGYDILEKYLQKNKFVAGDHLTIADVSIVASISTLAVIVPVDEKYAKVNAWWNLLKEEDWYKKANVPGLTQFEGFIKSVLK